MSSSALYRSHVLPTWQRSPLRWGDGAHVVHAPEESQLGSVCRGVLVPLMPPPARPDRGAPVGGLGLLGGAQVVEAPAVGACADGAVQAHRALARLLGLALARPHVQTWDESERWVSVKYLKVPVDESKALFGLLSSLCGQQWLEK